jgi:hydroxymethylpyrimidine pyrophosphatase-like HAD family hydrolase
MPTHRTLHGKHRQFSFLVVHDFDSLTERIVKVVGVGDDLEAVARCEIDMQARYSGRVSAARSQPYYLDVTHPKANKGEVVTMFSQICGVLPDKIATIGDMPNDVLMFKKSAISIAMDNSSKEVQKGHIRDRLEPGRRVCYGNGEIAAIVALVTVTI